MEDEPASLWKKLGLADYNSSRKITRREFAVLLDELIDPFNNIPVNVKGEIVTEGKE